MNAPRDDATLIARVRDGDRDAFAEIVRAHQASALRLAAIISGDPTEAYDIVQDSFVKAFHNIGRIRESDSLRPWLLRIVANEAKNSRRGRRRHEARADRQARLAVFAPPDTDDAAMRALDAEQLLRTVTRLGDDDRRIIACRYFAELGEAETADVLGIARGTVKSRTARALARLRAELDEQTGAER